MNDHNMARWPARLEDWTVMVRAAGHGGPGRWHGSETDRSGDRGAAPLTQLRRRPGGRADRALRREYCHTMGPNERLIFHLSFLSSTRAIRFKLNDGGCYWLHIGLVPVVQKCQRNKQLYSVIVCHSPAREARVQWKR